MARRLSAALILSAAFFAMPAAAEPVRCTELISGEGRMTHVDGSDDFKRYGGHVPAKLAEQRAIADWQEQVRAYCPDYSPRWWRALRAHVACDAGAGHAWCTATAVPARKYLSMFFR